MRIIVTGGAGFLGSNICEKLLKGEHEVICIDNLLTGSEENITHLKNYQNFKFINADVTEINSEILRFTQDDSGAQDDKKVDQIYHLASPASPNEKNPKGYHILGFETMLVNTTGTWNLCKLAKKLGAKFLFASTSEVYGDPKEHPQKETYNGNVSTIGPRAVYDESKRFGETITSKFVRSEGLDGRIIRIFNTYGPGMADDGRVVTTLIKKALKNEPLPVFGEGKQTRSFCFIDDMVDGIVSAMEKGSSGEVYNLGNPDEYNILELADKIMKLTGSNSELEFHELPEDDPMQRCPDISKARAELGWKPKISLEEGLKRYIDFLKR